MRPKFCDGTTNREVLSYRCRRFCRTCGGVGCRPGGEPPRGTARGWPRTRSGKWAGGRGGIFHCPSENIGVRHRRNRRTLPHFLFSLHACKKDTLCPFFCAHPLPPTEVVVKNPVLVIGKRKNHPDGWFFLLLVAGVGFEPHDLRVMSPTSYQAALPRDIKLVPETGIEPVRCFRITGF